MFERVLNVWKKIVIDIDSSPWFQRLESGKLGLEHYKGYLLETYHNTGLNPQIQAFATMYFKENHRDVFDLFYKHACSEIGHDMYAMQDLMNLGVSEQQIKATRPLPSTIALNAFVIHQIQFQSAVSYLGYLFHLEFMPTQRGSHYIEKLSGLGVPKNALTFIQEHATLDVGHNKMMKKYIEALVKTEKDFEDVCYAMNCTAVLHQRMIEDALRNGEKIFSPSQHQQKPA